MASLPAIPRPSGGDVNHGIPATIVLWVITAIATILTTLRLYTRMFILKHLGWDDHLNAIGMVLALAALSLMTRAVMLGIGRHLYYVEHTGDMPEVIDGMLLVRCAEFIIILSLAALKASMTLFLLRIFNNSHKKLRWFLIGWIIFNTLIHLLLMALVFPSCTPVQKGWDPAVEGTCWPHVILDSIGYIQAAVSCLTDIILSTAPIVLLWNVKINTRTKVGICALMAVGYATTSFCIARALYVNIWSSQDITWDVINLYIFAILEAAVGAIACALPTLRPFVRHFSKNPNSTLNTSPSKLYGEATQKSTSCSGWQPLSNDFVLVDYNREISDKDSTETFDNKTKDDSHITLTTNITIQRESASSPEATVSRGSFA